MGREVRGGLVTFFTMAYIIALNPLIIGTAADKNGNLVTGKPKFSDAAMTVLNDGNVTQSKLMVAAATALIAGLMTILMGVWGRFPLALATGLGLNALLAFVLAPQMTWPQAMGLVVWEGILVTLLVLTGVREAIFRAVPGALRSAISVGIGLFVTLVGMVSAGVVRQGSGTPLQLGIGGSLMGWPLAVCILAFILLIILWARKVPGAMLISMVVASVAAVILENTLHIGVRLGDKNPTGWSPNGPALPKWSDFATPDLGLLGRIDLFGAFAPDGVFRPGYVLGLVLIVFSLLLADFFDTMGTVVAVGAEADLLDEEGNPPHLREILLVDSLGAVAGGLGSVSSNTSYVESTAGVAEGARTGFASVVTGLAFLASIILAPVVSMVPAEAAAPVLAFVGFLMMSQVTNVDWSDVEVGVPAFLTIILMPFAYSITTGIGAGFVIYVLIKLLVGKAKQVHPLMWGVAAAFLVYFAQGVLMGLIDKI
ncbi:NCS2 family permease [Aestuariimicrobium sp. p3-SID1156]|uniref:NCS2 family permease n=1 Tax=Aestuariimicrobium sp. p3-SID1156 TaxID=2916038 RepID=UPI00223AE847|nr:NCS2 family permease [Aestuariimicrobium sp. p3-SID1156]MCT1458442.1 NCS2 family permease [Aestuariimicrobium sp. p3-SID1156]